MRGLIVMDRDQAIRIIRSRVAESLAIDLEEVRPESRLITDLGADSLDFVDLVFTLEKDFGIKLRAKDLDFLSRLDFSSPEVVKDGFLTKQAVEKIGQWLPEIGRIEDPDRVSPETLFSLITVETLWRMIEPKLGGA